MCGIAGLTRSEGDGAMDVDRVRAMIGLLIHRGPDAEGIVVRDNAVLGHRRLKIIDLDDRSNQPMIDAHGRALVFNGEIYNYRDLRRELESRWQFRTTSDTEVILAAYDAWGADCVRRFNGDWAFALHDPQTRSLMLSRDRLGVKPLYFAEHAGAVWFASEVRALVAAGVPARMTRQALVDVLKRGRGELRETTLLEGIRAVPPAHNLIVRHDGVVGSEEYWGEADLFEDDAPPSFEEATERFGDLFDQSVRLRLHADVPVGVCLSGGLDSSLIVAVASRHSHEAVRTFSGVAPGYDSDEGPYSALVADGCATEHVPIELRIDDLLTALPDFVRAQETPVAGINTYARYAVLRRAADDVTVLLDGQGGDETLAGYHRYHRLFKNHYPAAPFAMNDQPPRSRSALKPLEELEPALLEGIKASARDAPPLSVDTDPITRRMYEDLRGPGLLTLLHTEDRLTMAFSLEGRVPFLDHRLVELCFAAPLSYRIDDVDKRMSRSYARRAKLLPEAILGRTDKSGFATPFAEMLRRDPQAHSSMSALIAEWTERVPGIVRAEVLSDLLTEHTRGQGDRTQRLIRALSSLMFIEHLGVDVVDVSGA
jgi:asparagine synthase (glutamine-hydrolysing)